jgi:xylan 1,4-beta-xylosidase
MLSFEPVISSLATSPLIRCRRLFPLLFVSIAVCVCLARSDVLLAQEAVTIRVDAATNLQPLNLVWSYFGYDEPNYTYAPHGRELISEMVALSPVPVYFRTHNLLTTGDGTPALKWGSTNAYTEDASGRLVYDWKIVDRIFDTYVQAGAKPFVEIGFMPKALSTNPEPYQHDWPKGKLDTGWAYPPKDYAKWAELVRQLVTHCRERYGEREVASWYFEVWNEPDIFYWHGTPEEYDKLYDFTADAVKRAMASARVGGPATTGPGSAKASAFLQQFLNHCAGGTNYVTGKPAAPLDFISFHAKGSPKVVKGHVEMGIATQLRSVDRGFEIVTSFPQFSKLPIVISESDPDGCGACAARRGYPQYGYRNGTLYAVYTAATMKGILELARTHSVNLAGVLTWAFEFEDQPYFDGFRAMATNGIDKPELNYFRMAGMMAGNEVNAESSGALPLTAIIESGVRVKPDVDALAARAERSITVMAWNYHDDDTTGPGAPVVLNVAGIPAQEHRVLVRHYRIDCDHSNAYTAWLAMNSPQNPTTEQLSELKAAGQLQMLESPGWIQTQNGNAEIDFTLPRQSSSLIEISW